MSHNANKVNSQEPNRASEVSQTLGNLSDVTITSASDGQYLQYSSGSSAWLNVAAAVGSFEYMIIGKGETNAYSNSGETTITAGDQLLFYDSSSPAQSTITGATITKYSSTDWVSYVNLPAGKYLFCVTYRVAFSSSGYLTFTLFSGTGASDTWTTAVSSTACIGEDTTTYDNMAGYIFSYRELSSATDVSLIVDAVSGVASVTNQGNTPAQYSQLLIIKVGS